MPVLLLLVLLWGGGSLVSASASMAFLPRLVTRDRLQLAHARLDGADAVAQNAGPAVGGALATVIGAPATVLIASCTHVLAAVTTASIRVDEPVPSVPSRRAFGREVSEGLRWIYRSRELRSLALSTHVWFAGQAVLGTVLAPWALDQLQLTPFQFGLAVSGAGLGAVVGAVLSTAVGRRIGAGRAVIGAHVVSVVGVVLMVTAVVGTGWSSWVLLALGQGAHGFAMGLSNSHEMSYRQAMTPDALQARTNTTLRSFNRAVVVVVAPLGGVLAVGTGLATALIVAAALFVGAVLLLALSPFRGVRSVG